MKKKMFKNLMSMAVVFTVVMFGTVGVSAQDLPVVCDDGTFTITPVDDSPFPRASVGDECGVDNSGWVWEYIISGDPKKMGKLTKVQVYIPSLPPNEIKILDYDINKRGVGSDTKGYGKAIYDGIVFTIPDLSGLVPEQNISFCTDVNTTGMISIAFETAQTLTGCEDSNYTSGDGDQGPIGGIIGPGFAPSEFVAVETDRKVNLGPDGHIWAKKHPVTGCIKSFYNIDPSGNEIEVPGQTEPPPWMVSDGENPEILDIGNFESPLCREAVIARKGSPLTYWAYANGMYYCLGVYETSTGAWISPCPTY